MLAQDPKIYTELLVPIEKVACYSSLQMRVNLPQRVINEYAEIYRTGAYIEPIRCAELEGEFLVYDGFLRKMAALKAGVAQIKVIVAKAENRDQVVLWAVRAQAHEGLKRSNADKEHSVRQLLETELGQSMSANDIADAAGVDHKMVNRYRKQLESNISKGNALSDPSKPAKLPDKVRTPRGMRPRRYRTKKQREAERQARVNLFTAGPTQWPTPEETGRPAPELARLPHPDHPGKTYNDVFVEKHGYVQTRSLEKKTRQENEAMVREVAAMVRDIGAICQRLVAAVQKFGPPEFRTTLHTMKDDGRSVWTRKLTQYQAELLTALPIIRELLEVATPSGDDRGTRSTGPLLPDEGGETGS